MKIQLTILLSVSLIGCSSSLKVYNSVGDPLKGVPVNSPQLVRVTTVTEYEAAKGSEDYSVYCTNEKTESLQFMPLGERHYVGFDSAALGDSEFEITFNDQGLMKSISLNSEASAGVEQTNELLSTFLPFVAKPKAASEVEMASLDKETATQLKSNHCLKTGEKVLSVEREAIR